MYVKRDSAVFQRSESRASRLLSTPCNQNPLIVSPFLPRLDTFAKLRRAVESGIPRVAEPQRGVRQQPPHGRYASRLPPSLHEKYLSRIGE
jgi:hypothetical protein